MKDTEIERKYLVRELPPGLENYPKSVIAQGYLCTDPVVRIRRSNDDYILTYKGSGLMVRREYNLPLTGTAYGHLLQKADGRLIEKIRYRIPLADGHTAELDIFSGALDGLVLVEVEFTSVEAADAFCAPAWFGEDVTGRPEYQNSNLALTSDADAARLRNTDRRYS